VGVGRVRNVSEVQAAYFFRANIFNKIKTRREIMTCNIWHMSTKARLLTPSGLIFL
jgi:hypothetical protein